MWTFKGMEYPNTSTTYLHIYIYIKVINYIYIYIYINNCPVNGAIENILDIKIHPSSPIFHKGFCWNWVSPTSPAPGKGKGWKQVPAQEPNLMCVSLSIDPSICLSLHLSTYKYLNMCKCLNVYMCECVYIYIYIVSLPLSLSLSLSFSLSETLSARVLHALGAFVRLCAAIAYIYIKKDLLKFVIYLCLFLSNIIKLCFY